MNSKTLLIGAAVLALTSTANAGTTTLGSAVTINPQVDLVGSFGLAKGAELKFGVVVVPAGEHALQGKKITVKPNGYIYADSGVTLLGVASIGANDGAAAAAGTNTVSAGSLTVTGDIPTLRATREGASVSLVFQGDGKVDANNNNAPIPGEIDLKDTVTSTVCGTVNAITLSDDITAGGSGTGTEYTYGGTLTFSANAAAGMHCVGTATVTMMFNE